MNLAPIVERLVERVPALMTVGGSAELARCFDILPIVPGAFVLPAAEVATESAFMGQLVQQQVALTFSVVIAARNLSDSSGAKAIDALDPIRVSIRQSLLNWTPDGADAGCEFVSGEFNAFGDGIVWWIDEYRTSYQIRSE